MAALPLTKFFGIIVRPVGARHAMEARSQLRHRPTFVLNYLGRIIQTLRAKSYQLLFTL